MNLSSEARELINNGGGFFKFVETARFDIDFLMKYSEEIEYIIHELKEFNFAKYELEKNYLGTNGDPPEYDIKEIKKMLRKNKAKIPRKATEQELRKYAYDYFITLNRIELERVCHSRP